MCISLTFFIIIWSDFRWNKKSKLFTILGAKTNHFRWQKRQNSIITLEIFPEKFLKTLMQLAERFYRSNFENRP